MISKTFQLDYLVFSFYDPILLSKALRHKAVGCSNIRGTLETLLHNFLADRLTFSEAGGGGQIMPSIKAGLHSFLGCYYNTTITHILRS